MLPRHPVSSGYQNFNLPPLPEHCKYILVLGSPEDQHIEENLEATLDNLSVLENYFHKYTQIAEKHIEPPQKTTKQTYKKFFASHSQNTDQQSSGNADPYSIFALRMLNKYVYRHKIMHRDISASIASDISLLMCHVTFFIERRIPVHLDEKNLKQMVTNRYKVHREYQKLFVRVKILQYHVKNTASRAISSTVSAKSLSGKLIQYEDIVNDKFNYADMSLFDSDVMNYFTPADYSMKIDPLSRSFSSQTNPIMRQKNIVNKRHTLAPLIANRSNSTPVLVNNDSLMTELSSILEVDTQKKTILLKCAVTRLLFSRSYLYDPTIAKVSFRFVRNCSFIRRLTLNELGVPDNFMLMADHNETIDALFQSEEKLKEVSNMLYNVQFLTYPTDIAYELYKISMALEKCFTDVTPQSIGTIPVNFDDFFIAFVCLVASNPPANAEGITIILEKYRSMEMCSQFKHSVTCFNGANKFIKDIMSSQLDKTTMDKLKGFVTEKNSDFSTFSLTTPVYHRNIVF